MYNAQIAEKYKIVLFKLTYLDSINRKNVLRSEYINFLEP